MVNDWLRRQRRLMHLCTECGEPMKPTTCGYYRAVCEVCKAEIKRKQDGTLCWKCKNAVPDKNGHGCNWSRKRQPVEGWVAKETKLKMYKNEQGEEVYTKSYHVILCPEFEEDER